MSLSTSHSRQVEGLVDGSLTRNGDEEHEEQRQEPPATPTRAAQKQKSCRGICSLSLVLYSLSAFNNGFYINSRGSYVEALANQTGAPISTMGSYFLATGISSAIIAVPVGWGVDNVDAHRMLIAGLGVRALGCACVPFISTFWELIVDTLVIGLSLPLIGVSLRACTMWGFDKQSASVALNLVMGSYGSASVFAPLLFGWLLKWNPLRELTHSGRSSAAADIVNWCTVLLCCISLLLAGVVPAPKRQEDSDVDVDVDGSDVDVDGACDGGDCDGNGYDGATTMIDVATLDPAGSSEGSDIIAKASSKIANPRYRVPLLAIVAVYLGLSVGAECTIGGWLVSYAQSTSLFDAFHANMLASTLWAVFTLARFIFASLVAFVHPGWILMLGHILCVSAVTLLLAVGDAATEAEVYVFTILFGAGVATFFPNGMGVMRRLYNLSALEQSFFSVAASVGNGLVPAIAGWTYTNLESPLVTTAICAGLHVIVGAVTFVVMRAEARSRANPQTRQLQSPLL